MRGRAGAITQIAFLLGLFAVGRALAAPATEFETLAGPAPTVLWGRVAVVAPDQGQLVLSFEDGTWAELTSDPRLLRNIHPGQIVQAVLDGSVVRFVEPVGAPFTLAQSGDLARLTG